MATSCRFDPGLSHQMKKYIDKLVKISGGEIRTPRQLDAKLKSLLPKDYLNFMSITDGLSLRISEIFSVSEFITEQTSEFKQKYLDAYGMNYKSNDWLFFANDGMGGYYAFKNISGDKKVYYFNHEFPNYLETYKTFTHFIKKIIENQK